MQEILRRTVSDLPPGDPVDVLIRLLGAAVLGWGVSWVYRVTKGTHEIAPTFPVTLVLLAVLIAMVTQVIGDNVARAFSLVGALAIVRFRTVVRDTRDTAFVIFAVVVGMAMGARDLVVAGAGMAVVTAAAFLMRPRRGLPASHLLRLRVGLGQDLEPLVGAALDAGLSQRRLVSISTARQGLAMEAAYEGTLRPGTDPAALLKALNRIEGVQQVELLRQALPEE